MEREQILRDDFPSVRKGWDPDAVRAHLRAVADSASGARGGAPLADGAAERVRTVIAAAEELAAEISAEAQNNADRLLADARLEAERLLADAREQADARVEQARAAVEGLVSQADELRTKVGTLGEELAGTIRSSAASIGTGEPRAEVPGPAVVPEPTPPPIPEPTPDPVPEPTPDPVPEPTPDPVPEPTPEPSPEPTPDPGPPQPDLPDAPDVEPPVPEPDVTPPAADSTSTEDLIAQLRGGDGSANGSATNGSAAPAVSESDQAAARLVAMNMALDGASREDIAAKLRDDFGDGVDHDAVLDDVLARAAR
jgi:outer membrane biosynthesis protein TonB